MKTLITIILSFIIFLRTVTFVYADPVAGSSAAIKIDKVINVTQNTFDSNKIYKIKKAMNKVLNKYNSPLVNNIDSFVDACATYKLDCYLLPSIAGLESTFGRFILPQSYNPFGWGGGMIMFKNWDEGIMTVAHGLRNNYLNKGADNLEDIGYIYSESPTWSPRVQSFINEFNNEEKKLELFLSMNPVK
jgi:hypothetical protein